MVGSTAVLMIDSVEECAVVDCGGRTTGGVNEGMKGINRLEGVTD